MSRDHLAIEQPLFDDKPHVWIQWKGTNVCCDVHCSCGEMSHYDGDFMYYVRCRHCQKVWEVGTHIMLYEAAAGSFDPDSVGYSS